MPFIAPRGAAGGGTPAEEAGAPITLGCWPSGPVIRQSEGVSRVSLTIAAALMVGTGLAVVVAIAVIPMHVTFGAGSLRCGTVLQPDITSEIGDVCPKARGEHLRAAVGSGVFLALVALGPLLPPVASGERASRLWLITSILVWVALATLALAWIGTSVEYSPPADVFDL